MKYLLIRLEIRDGEREYTIQTLYTTRCKNINFAAERCASKYWGQSKKGDKGWYAWGGEIHIKVEKVTPISEKDYEYLYKLFY